MSLQKKTFFENNKLQGKFDCKIRIYGSQLSHCICQSTLLIIVYKKPKGKCGSTTRHGSKFNKLLGIQQITTATNNKQKTKTKTKIKRNNKWKLKISITSITKS